MSLAKGSLNARGDCMVPRLSAKISADCSHSTLAGWTKRVGTTFGQAHSAAMEYQIMRLLWQK